jgi:hypothetical protein
MPGPSGLLPVQIHTAQTVTGGSVVLTGFNELGSAGGLGSGATCQGSASGGSAGLPADGRGNAAGSDNASGTGRVLLQACFTLPNRVASLVLIRLVLVVLVSLTPLESNADGESSLF